MSKSRQDGTPGETRTHYLALRRRTLYPGELRGRVGNIVTDDSVSVKEDKIAIPTLQIGTFGI